MIHNDVNFVSVPTGSVQISSAEVAARLGTDRGFEHQCIDRCLSRLEEAVSYRYAYVRIPVSFPRDGVCNFEFLQVESRDLYRNLAGCKEVFLLAVTTGIGVDRLIAKFAAVSNAEAFLTDALASAAAESLCDIASEEINRASPCKPRFSPGYGDLSLTFQKPLLDRLDADARLGITLSKALLMTPIKSITAIMGVLP